MSVFQFHLVGGHKHIELEVAADTLTDLRQEMSCSRFVEGRLVEPDGDGVLLAMLIATSRIEYIVSLG